MEVGSNEAVSTEILKNVKTVKNTKLSPSTASSEWNEKSMQMQVYEYVNTRVWSKRAVKG